MFTPQQLNEIGFTKAVFGGYDMDSVHDVLDPLTEDYTALYKENAVLKSKLRILVEKLEEYRQQGKQPAARSDNAEAEAEAEDNAKEIIRNAEDKAAALIREAHERAKSIVGEANAKAERSAMLSAGELELEEDRLAQAKQTAYSFIQAIQANIDRHQELLDNLKLLELPEEPEREAEHPGDEEEEHRCELQEAAPKRTAPCISEVPRGERALDDELVSTPVPHADRYGRDDNAEPRE